MGLHFSSYGLGTREPFIINQCPAVNCELTVDKQKLNKSDYVLVKYKKDLEFRDLPPQANPKTLLTLYMAHPVLDLSSARKFNRVFNLTATFLLNSHILPFYYAKARFFWSQPSHKDANNKTITQNSVSKLQFFHLKRSIAALVDFDCSSKPAQKYISYLKRLNSTIPVTIFGKCGKPCGFKTCRKRLYQTYKFTLIYEPFVRCAGHVSEMFLEAFAYETIPVVFNRSSYEFFVPESGFIRAYEFDSAKSLGFYLRSLEIDVNKAGKFFEWKRHVQFSPKAFGTFCDLCIRAHIEKSKSSIVENIEEYLKCS